MRTARRVAVVSGASAGLGRAVVRRLAHSGWDLGLLARGQAGLEGAHRDVEQAGGRALVVPADVADAEAIERAAERIETQLGPIDAWINVAMTTVFAELVDITPEEFRRVTEVTYLGYVFGTRVALERMLPRNRGVIVQVGSALAYRGIPLQSAYCGAKHAIRGFTESVRCELLHRRSGVRISMVQMPALNTPQFGWCLNKMGRRAQPVPPIYEPELAARAIEFVLEHPRRELYVGGSTAAVIWGEKIAAGAGDRYLARTGYDSQQYDGPVGDARANLWKPVDDETDHGATGAFGRRAHRRSFELWAATHRTLFAGLALASVAGVALLVRRLR